MRPRILAWVPLLLVLAILPLAGSPAEAGHWCSETLVTVDPPFVPASTAQIFVIRLENTGTGNTTLSSVTVRFPWEANARNLGGGSMDAGAFVTFTVTSTPVPAGTHVVTVTFVGTNDEDVPPAAVTCEATRTVQTITTNPDFMAGIVTILLTVLGIVITVVVVIVVVAVVLSRKKRPPNAPPQGPPPPFLPPQAPPPGPPSNP